MFERVHHQRIAEVLARLDGALLRRYQCLFGGGTVIALRYGEYRESVDMDFLISDLAGYRELRQLLTGPQGMSAILKEGAKPLELLRDFRADQYGIRTQVAMQGVAIKFEIVLEGRIHLDSPMASDEICGVPTLTPVDMAASKMLANSDRWADRGVFNRDLIDLAMMKPGLQLLREAIAKAETAYGSAIVRDLMRALEELQSRQGWLDRCMETMAMTMPKAVLWKNIKAVQRLLLTLPQAADQ